MIPSKYEPLEIEKKWYKEWEENKCFEAKPNPNKKPYTVVIPPPNVTGVLHMGHILNNTIQDVLVRKARMQGKETCWIPGTDHASIATEAKVVKMLSDKGISKKDLNRTEFLEHAFQWKEKYGGIILKQLRKLGASCDWSRTMFTMDNDYSKAVINVFVSLYNQGLIYRGIRMINWDPKGKTAISDEEVIRKEVNSKLYYVNYQVEGEKKPIIIATTRPETIPADTAVCVNPNDNRYKHIIGKTAIIPISNRKVKIIADKYVDKDFGTGFLKITPAHDINDYELGIKHNLDTIDLLDDNGCINENGGDKYKGLDRFVARKQIVKDFKDQGILVKTENIKNNIGFSERTDAIIEPKLSMQWFLKMKELSKPALENVTNGNIKFHPHKFINTYKHWMNNIHDWCISRQLWWGHRIPAWYLPDNKIIVAENETEALQKARKIDSSYTSQDLKQDEDVLDTWISSWLWPISAFKGILEPKNKEFKYFYPTQDLVTAPEILFFWVARMIIAGYTFTNKPPFKNVYLTGIVRDKKRRKMSKSLGNSPDPLNIIHDNGADGTRVGMLLSSPAGNDLLYDEKLVIQGRNFANKIWNAFRLIYQWETDDNPTPTELTVAGTWMNAKINEALEKIESLYDQYRISDVLMTLYKLVWNDYCSNYLEMIKPPYLQKITEQQKNEAVQYLDIILRVLHPYMPFITEEIWQYIKENVKDKTPYLMLAKMPKKQPYDKPVLDNGTIALELISEIRNLRTSHKVPKADSCPLYIKTPNASIFTSFEGIIKKLGSIKEVKYVQKAIDNSQTIVINEHTFFIVLKGIVDNSIEKEKLTKELEYIIGFKASVEKKLNNQRFVDNAPEQVVGIERKKLADANTKIETIKRRLQDI